jgi:putative flippase GtrA
MTALLRRLLAIQFVRFGAVGATVTVCFMALNAAFTRGLGWPAQVAFLAAYPPALGLHFLLNKLWTFGDRRATTVRHVREYLLAAGLTFMIQWPAFTLLQSVGHLPGWLAAGAANLIQMAASFLLLQRRVFNQGVRVRVGKSEEAVAQVGRRQGSAGSVRIATGLALAGVAAFYIWTVSGTPGSFELRTPKNDYYNLLVQGFQRGHLYLNATPDPALLALPEGARPGAAPYLLDASLYRGHYYLYFGVVPAVLLYWPYAALTGHGLSGAMGALLFALAGTVLATLAWLELRRRLFPWIGACWAGVAVLAIGLGTGVPSALRHPLFYEAATGAGYTFAMAELWAVLRAWRTPARSGRWLLAAGLACGLAVGSRANLAPAGLLLLVLGSWNATSGASVGRRRRALAVAVGWAGLGVGSVGIGLAAYNFERFGNPVEFGHSYQLGLNPKRLFHGANLEHNLAVYYLTPPTLNAYFPFVGPRAESPKPPDYVGREQADGEWIWWPLVLAAVVATAGVLKRESRERRLEIGWALALPGTLFLVNFLLTGAIGVRSNRYLMDFHPALVLAVLSGLALALHHRSRAARWGALLSGVGLMAVILFNCLASFQVHGFFADNDPAGYDQVARLGNRLAWPWLRFGRPVGDREVELQWPTAVPVGTREPLLGAGTPTFDDVIWIEYGAVDRARLVYDYGDAGAAFGAWFAFPAGGISRVRVAGALLLPRAGHPWYGSRTEAEQRALKRTLEVWVDGHLRFNRDVPSHDSSPRLQAWGAWTLINGRACTFSGRLGPVEDRPLNEVPVLARLSADRGSVDLEVLLPTDRMGATEPLVQFGSPGRFDLVAIRYARPGIVQFIHDQSGGGATRSEEIATDYTRPHAVTVEMPGATNDLEWRPSGPVQPGRVLRAIQVHWDGRVVFESQNPPWPTPHPEVVLGANLVHSSASAVLFRGELSAGARRAPLGILGAGGLEFRPDGWTLPEAGEGILLRCTSVGGDTANLIWRRRSGEAAQFGWNEAGVTAWSKAGALPATGPLHLRIGPSTVALDHFTSDLGPATVVQASTELWGDPPVRAEAILAPDWSGTALAPALLDATREPTTAAVPASLPGIIRIRFRLPTHPLVTGSPLLSAGRTGAADSVYLRQRPDGLFVLGIDHWMFPATESPPFSLSVEEVHAAIIELGSIAAADGVGARQANLTIDGKQVMAGEMALYPVRPGEVVIGANPLGMSTSGATFDGEIVSVRTHLQGIR